MHGPLCHSCLRWWWMCMQAREALRKLPPLIEIAIEDDAEITVCGDIHGQFYDLLNIFDMNGYPSHSNPYVFNGAVVSLHLGCIGVCPASTVRVRNSRMSFTVFANTRFILPRMHQMPKWIDACTYGYR